jgi:L-arabinonolactonase
MTVTCNPAPIDMEGLLFGPPAPLNDDQVSTTARLLVDCRCHLGECILWDDRQNAVLFTSILDRKFHKLVISGPENLQLQSYSLPRMLCAFGLLEEGVFACQYQQQDQPGYIVAWEDCFQLYDLEGDKALSGRSEGENVNPYGLPDRLNDGRVDPTGKHFVCGGCAGSDATMKVYKCEYIARTKTLKHTPILNKIRTTNSICWSLDGNFMFVADSPTKEINQYDYDRETGVLKHKRLVHAKTSGDPDGSVVDAQGFIWNATWRQGKGTGMVDRIDPSTGKVVFTVHLPDGTSEASCCCFGGRNLDILFITTAWEHLDPNTEPHAGGLYAVKLPQGISGCQEKRFRTSSQHIKVKR